MPNLKFSKNLAFVPHAGYALSNTNLKVISQTDRDASLLSNHEINRKVQLLRSNNAGFTYLATWLRNVSAEYVQQFHHFLVACHLHKSFNSVIGPVHHVVATITRYKESDFQVFEATSTQLHILAHHQSKLRNFQHSLNRRSCSWHADFVDLIESTRIPLICR